MLISLIFFLFFLLFFVYLPARIFFILNKIQEPDELLINLGLSLLFGIVFLTAFSLLVSLLNLSLSLIWLLPLVSIFIYWRFLRTGIYQPPIPKADLVIFFIIVISSLVQSFPLLKLYRLNTGGLTVPSVHDNLWNIAVMNELSLKVPPAHPAISGYLLVNHHYFYHYFLVLINKVTSINFFDLYFRFGPLLVSFLFGLALYAFASLFTKKISIRALAVFLGYYCGNLAFLAPLIFKSVKEWRGNLFFADQPFDQIFNPYTVLGFAVFLFAFYSLSKYLKLKKLSPAWLVVASLFIGASFGIKSFGGLILILSLMATSLFGFLVYKDKKIIILTLTSLLVFFLVFFLISRPGSVTLKFVPGWLLREMMVGEDKLNLPQYADIENYYQSSGNYPGLIKIKTIELLIYLIGNLGVRLLGLFFLVKLLIQKLKPYEKITVICIFTAVSVSLFLPLLFNLSASPYNIIQFTPFSLVLLSILTALFLGNLFDIFKKAKIGKILIIVLVLILSLPVNVRNFISKFSHSGDLIKNSEMEMLDYLKNNSPSDSLILINPADFRSSPIYIPALSQRKVFLADPGYARQTGIDPQKRLEEIELFFQNNMQDEQFLKKNKISYIYLPKNNLSAAVERLLRLSDNIYQIIKENPDILLLRIKL